MTINVKTKEFNMKLPEYITKDEVSRVCNLLGIQDWTKFIESDVPLEDAKIIQRIIGGEANQISAEAFKQGLDIELEHGILFPDANVTNNHPILTGKIVLAHLKEMLDYYFRLEVAELEGDLKKAFEAKSHEKMFSYYEKLISARLLLIKSDVNNLD
jgi:hypothetical protein